MSRQGEGQKANQARNPELAFGSVLRRIRRERHVSQQALADRSGYHRTYIGLLEGGQKSPSLRTIFNIATVLRVTPSNFLKRVERELRQSKRKALQK